MDTDLIRGGGGIYKVWAGKDLIWDKHSAGRFPDEEEILGKLQDR